MKKNRYNFIKGLLLTTSVTFILSCEKTELAPANPELSIASQEEHRYADAGEAVINEFLEAGVPGVSVTISTSEGTWTGTGGVADIADQIPLEPSHAMHLGSTSKIFAATLIMMLQEDGLLNIDDQLKLYLLHAITDKIPNGNVVTLRQLLNQTSGIPEHLGVKSYFEILNQSQIDLSAEEALEYIYGKKPLDAPGEAFSYSNSNYLLLALVIKYVTGAPSAYDVLESKIIEPLGLENTWPGTKVPAQLSLGYYEYYGYMKELTHIDNHVMGGEDRFDGGIISSSYDLVRFMNALFSGQLISEESLSQMQQFIAGEVAGMEHIKGYGFGLMNIETDFGKAVGHYGTIYCFNSALFRFPEHDLTIAFTLNGNSGTIQERVYDPVIFRHLMQ